MGVVANAEVNEKGRDRDARDRSLRENRKRARAGFRNQKSEFRMRLFPKPVEKRHCPA